MAETSESNLYGEEYYRTGYTLGDEPPYRKGEPLWEEFFARVADEIVLSLKPKTVFDAGCAIGFLVEALWDRGVTAHGRDISEFAISQVRPDVKPYCEIGSVTDPIEGRYDLITCVEVLEHLPESDAIDAIDALTEASDQILFSSSPNDFDQPTHVNVRPPIYWSRLFARRSFRPVMRYDASFIAPHAMLFVRCDELPSDDVLMGHAELVRMRLALATARQEKLQAEHLLAETKLQLEADLDAAQTDLRDMRESCEAERRASELKQQTLHMMATSASWRLTAPARSINAKLRRAWRLFTRSAQT